MARRYFSYDIGEVKTLDFYAFISARYDVKRDMYRGAVNPIAIKVYHILAHTYDVDDMIAALELASPIMKETLVLFSSANIASSSFHATAPFLNRFPTPFRSLRA